MRWVGLICGLALAGVATSGIAAPVALHRVWANGDCATPLTETIDVPRGRISIHLVIKGWSAAAYAGIPYWMAFQRYEPEKNGYTGWTATLAEAADPMHLRGITSVRTPYVPKAGGQLELTEVDEVLVPFRMQVQITGPTWHSGDGACHQGAMETWLTVDTAGGDQGSLTYAGNWTGGMTLTQNGTSVSGTSNGGSGDRVVGEAQGPNFNGYWLSSSSRNKCATERNGTWYWGRLRWTLTADGRHFVGTSGYCEADPTTPWNGDRVGGSVQTTQQPPVIDQGGRPGTAGAFGGQWTSNWGAMNLAVSGTSLSGTFEHSNGKIAGQAEAATASGYWMQDSAGQRCDAPRNGTYYWGRFRWTLAADGHSFNGLWGYCDAVLDSSWAATRVGGGSGGSSGGGESYQQPTPPSVTHQTPTGGEEGYAKSEHQVETKLYDNWNTAGCGFTDTSILDLDAPTHLTRLDIWFNWREGEREVSYTVTSGGRNVGGGTLTRADCDPYQSAWCEARDAPNTDLGPGRFEFRTARGGVCQNSGSGGAGFIRAYGYETGGRGRR